MATAPALREYSPSFGSAAPAGVSPESGPVRRRADTRQGQALEMLGHAVEYLVDSRMFLVDEPATKADAEALQILMRLSCCIFSECHERAPTGRRLRRWMMGRLVREAR